MALIDGRVERQDRSEKSPQVVLTLLSPGGRRDGQMVYDRYRVIFPEGVGSTVSEADLTGRDVRVETTGHIAYIDGVAQVAGYLLHAIYAGFGEVIATPDGGTGYE